ncbi:hypothetical protein METBIDRAFT_110948 [Metschnikowia bicuspidata var. bicuspidata NRRL YB-4993]|uniref:Uncharacterized protein n=1 Tax=Metschnikowia bicuspidata var. bicuspidata NRRL YB-4993 TaxID=869754 RepID=A0A1A0HI83_9ASCO|nr:hypothetical protein METBIDRAFT_110948 [Metschnikowia bicuspidata var. bicuspidata NRRL YB-4993]OBA23715.1 hypothetical protein METBIDRAFT_110948 [Metschnikowia bicuspidata var. bicuspidata NRRL YB-4993]
MVLSVTCDLLFPCSARYSERPNTPLKADLTFHHFGFSQRILDTSDTLLPKSRLQRIPFCRNEEKPCLAGSFVFTFHNGRPVISFRHCCAPRELMIEAAAGNKALTDFKTTDRNCSTSSLCALSKRIPWSPAGAAAKWRAQRGTGLPQTAL